MTHRYKLSLAGLFLWLSAGAAIAQDQSVFEDTAGFRGTVTEAGTGLPLPGATIHLGSRLSQPVAVTDVAGQFVVDRLAPDTYRVFAERDGMVFTESCRNQPELPCLELTLVSGQMAEIKMQMQPAATLSGRVLDASGEPVVGVRVSLQTYDYTSGIAGERVLANFPAPGGVHATDLSDCRSALTRAAGPQDRNILTDCDDLGFGSAIGRGVTNEEGEWRLAGIPPGEYYVVASTDRAEALDRALPNRQPGTWLPVYFPGTPFQENALPVRVTSAPEVSGLDIRWAEHAPVSIRGRVSGLPEETGRAFPLGESTIRIDGLIVSVTTANGLPVPTAELDLLHRSEQFDQTTGDFEFLVPPFGDFVLTATVGGFQAPSHSGRLRLDVGAYDVNDIVLPVVPAADVPGQMIFDPRPTPEEVGGVWISFGYHTAGASIEMGSPVSPDGTFVLSKPMRRDWEISVEGLPRGYYLESASFGGIDVLRDGFNPADAPGSVVVVRVGDLPAGVTGRVVDSHGDLFAGAKVTLVPEGTLRGRRDLYRSVETDAEGRFTLDTIPPGAYRIFAWQSIPESAERNDDFLASYLGRGRFVTVDGNATVDVELPLIER